MVALGIDRDDEVVVYDDAGGAVAARMWWMLRSIGHESARLLDGGLAAWVDGGRPLSREPGASASITYPQVAGFEGVVSREDLDDRPIIDVRAPERYRGDVEPIDPKAGHIPGAVNIPLAGNLGPDGRFLRAADLRSRYEDTTDDTIVSCGSGINACHAALAMVAGGSADAGRLYRLVFGLVTTGPAGIGGRQPLITSHALEAIESSDVDQLLRIVDGLCKSREWDDLIELRSRCREAVERGKQVWGVEEHIRYRLALEAPAERAGPVVSEGQARFALGPLAEVAASTKSFAELEPYLEAGPERMTVAAERVVRGEAVDLAALELPGRASRLGTGVSAGDLSPGPGGGALTAGAGVGPRRAARATSS